MADDALKRRYEELLKLLGEIDDLERAGAILSWDQHTQMPHRGHRARGDQLATLERLVHQRLVAPQLAQLLDELAPLERSLPVEDERAGVIRVARRRQRQAARIPQELVAESARLRPDAFKAWLTARGSGEFGDFAPYLERLIDISRRKAEALNPKVDPMQALLDTREPGLELAAVERVFADLRQGLVPLAASIFGQGNDGRDALISQAFDHDTQLGVGLAAVRAIGFDCDARGRMDLSVHPFSTPFSSDDVRITTRVNPLDFRTCFFALLHEAGHGTYMQGIPERLRQTPLHAGASAGMHESQSRLWENIVGRSRPFWEFFLPIARAFFPLQLGRATVDDMYRACNAVAPSLIRVEADEVTYNLHIMLRYELERDVFSGALSVDQLPAAWNEKLESYLGITPPDDVRGVLQDIHWSMGFGASFVGYTLGNVMAVALYDRALADHPRMHDCWRDGDFSQLLSWMNDHVHAHGAALEPNELMLRASGEPISADPYLAYIKQKFGELYDL